ncbi:hypothetical protein ZWY2020_025852 [Hordeum vulgare]|nr:hypothetical protein ZWY2020_025852 [Hordeum vulgare]
MWLSSLPCSVRRRRPPPSGCRGRCAMGTARDVEEVVHKLASDRVRPRDVSTLLPSPLLCPQICSDDDLCDVPCCCGKGLSSLGAWLQATCCDLHASCPNTVRAKPAQLASGTPTSHLSYSVASHRDLVQFFC